MQKINFYIISNIIMLFLMKSLAYAEASGSLLADNIFYDFAKQEIIAKGNVRVYFNTQILRTELIIFDNKNAVLMLPDNFEIVAQDGTILKGQSAILNQENLSGIIKVAQILFDQQAQLAANKIIRPDERYSILDNAVFSTCTICQLKKTPLWQIQARRIIHDKYKKRIYYTNPTLKIFGVPVLYLPYLSTPDPSQKRATGLLVPEMRFSNTLGYRIIQPYYITLDDHSDATLTPSISTQNSFVLAGEYRKNYKNSSIKVQGAVAFADPLTNKKLRNTIDSKATFYLKNGFQLTTRINFASDKSFKKQYDFGDEDRLRNFINLEKTTKDSYRLLATSYTQSLRKSETDEDIPLILPLIYYKKNLFLPKKLGQLFYELYSRTLIRKNKNYSTAFAAKIEWHKPWVTNSGLMFDSTLALQANYHMLSKNPNYARNHYTNIIPTGSLTIRYPLMRKGKIATYVFEPIAQLVYTPDHIKLIPNEDMQQVEFDHSNLFSTDRFYGFDRNERGFRLNIGLKYLRYDPSGWTLSAIAGRIFRIKNLNQFSSDPSSKLSANASDYVTSLQIDLPNKLSLFNRLSFDNNFQISKNESNFIYSNKKIALSMNYVWLDHIFMINDKRKQQELTMGFAYQATPNWQFNSRWQHDLIVKKSSEIKFGVQYANECATIDASLSLKNEGFAKLTRQFSLNISLEGLGSRNKKKRFARKCNL